jgi:hypothetical protein
MPRPKGSKNKTVNQKIDELIEDVQKLQVDEAEKAEAIEELEDLLSPEVEISVKQPEVVAEIKPASKDKIFVGYHPITGKEVWN